VALLLWRFINVLLLFYYYYYYYNIWHKKVRATWAYFCPPPTGLLPLVRTAAWSILVHMTVGRLGQFAASWLGGWWVVSMLSLTTCELSEKRRVWSCLRRWQIAFERNVIVSSRLARDIGLPPQRALQTWNIPVHYVPAIFLRTAAGRIREVFDKGSFQSFVVSVEIRRANYHTIISVIYLRFSSSVKPCPHRRL